MIKGVRLGSAMLLLISYFLPWIEDGLLGISSEGPLSLLDGDSEERAIGKFLLVIPILAILTVVLHKLRAVGVIAGLISLAISLFVMIRIQSDDNILGVLKPAVGLYLALAGSAGVLLFSILKDKERLAAYAGNRSVPSPMQSAVPQPASHTANHSVPSSMLSAVPQPASHTANHSVPSPMPSAVPLPAVTSTRPIPNPPVSTAIGTPAQSAPSAFGTCKQCGHQVLPTYKFCRTCGSKIG